MKAKNAISPAEALRTAQKRAENAWWLEARFHTERALKRAKAATKAAKSAEAAYAASLR